MLGELGTTLLPSATEGPLSFGASRFQQARKKKTKEHKPMKTAADIVDCKQFFSWNKTSFKETSFKDPRRTL